MSIADLFVQTEFGAALFLESHREEVERYRHELSQGIKTAKDQLLADVAEISADHPLCLQIVGQANEYVDWLQWSLWDLPYFAVATKPELPVLRRRAAACAFVYLAGRVFDDVLDRHFWYKGKRPTLLSMATSAYPRGEGAEALTILAGLLLCSEGLLRLADPEVPDFLVVLQKVLASFRRAVVGAIMEQAPKEGFTGDSYERLIALKNVDFWRILYSALDPRRASPLYPFLERYYSLAQKLNDLQDWPEDEKRGQPNLVSLFVKAQGPAGKAFPEGLETHLAEELLALGRRAQELPEPEQSIALLKLGESLKEAFRLGLFPDAKPPPAPAPAPEPVPAEAPPLGLVWYSALADVVERAGANALEDVDCGICRGKERRRLFEKQGFTYHRCLTCSHVYVSPRLRLDVQLRMGAEREGDDDENDFLEVQSIFAEPICHMLRMKARGTRLLDLGFGRGYLLKLARAYGFEAYGVDSSSALAKQMEPEFGRNVCTRRLGVDPIPWGSFDVIILSHVAEHFADPASVLKDVRSKLAPGGILYVAVPDMDSLQFKIFGKTWDVVSPLAHLQYFNEKSLTRLLTDCGFDSLERIQHPELPRELTPKWMRLMRRLGGDESGELAMLARRPVELPPAPGKG
ncbi:MAG TPA: class I SAM-dependent methyltransferase [Myxococcaceae bacterium]|jgi:SAM-dependent methyltransferase